MALGKVLCACAGKLEYRTTQHWCARHDALQASISVIDWEQLIEVFAWDGSRTTIGGQALSSRVGLYTREFRRTAARGTSNPLLFLPVEWRSEAVKQLIGLEEAQMPIPQDQLPFGADLE